VKFRLSENSKAILKEKRERAKRRELLKKNFGSILVPPSKEISATGISEDSTDTVNDNLSSEEKSENMTENIQNPPLKTKFQQKLRNRISAQQSRDKRKVYVENLETKYKSVESENRLLRNELDYYRKIFAGCSKCQSSLISPSNPRNYSFDAYQKLSFDRKLQYDIRQAPLQERIQPGRTHNKLMSPMLMMLCLATLMVFKAYDSSSHDKNSFNRASIYNLAEKTSKRKKKLKKKNNY
jgi:hypothetical protein